MWQPIDTAPKNDDPDDKTGFPRHILLGCFHRGDLMWAMAAYYASATYGYVHCASRSGWATDYMPKMAHGADRARHPGEWIVGEGELAPTHWMDLQNTIENR